ncbi:hypothetical protein RRG08_016403 [Elysia crispata]|uniref:Uncharacterized protein n=1 Tax=Elysia crispata TaxID=231223 RepID=A0AAE0Y9J4_9GAST|nr:hypothetical protein RRG08_016403 [Elysia crispata]
MSNTKCRFPMCVFLWTLTFFLCRATVDTLQFTLRKGVRISSGATEIRQMERAEMTLSLCAALCGVTCGTFHVSHTTGVCVTFTEKFFNKNVRLASDPGWTIGYNRFLVTDGDWVLAFRAQAGIEVRVYETWVSDGTHHDSHLGDSSDFPQACLRLVDYESCDRHFRSEILDSWGKILEVRFSFIKANAEVAYVVFNGTGTDRESWFRPTRILSSTWLPGVTTDSLTRPEIKGYCSSSASTCRRFKLYGPVTGCATEWAYTLTIDAPYDKCADDASWPHAGNPEKDFPIFLYSASGRGGLGSDKEYPFMQRADVMAVWVKFAWPRARM